MSTNPKPSPPVLPGFYFDADRGKYFRIQPNHIAPPDAKYSRQAVTAERRLKEQQHDADKKKFKGRKRQKLTITTSATAVAGSGTSIIDSGLPVTQPPVLLRSSYLESCAGGILRRRLGNVQRQTSSTIVKHEWAARVEGRTVFSNLVSETFAADRENGQLFTLCPPGARQWWAALCVTKPRTTITTTTTTTIAATVKDHDATDERDSPAQAAVAKTMYPRDLTTCIDQSPGLLRCIDTVNNSSDSVFWVTHRIGPGALMLGPQGLPEYIGTPGLLSTIHFSRNRGAWSSVTLLPNMTNGINSDDNNNSHVIWDLKTNESGTKVVFAGNAALWVCDIERILNENSRAMSMIGGSGGEEGGGGELPWPNEWMCVGWKEPNAVMAGDRAGRVWLSDVRMAAAGVIRARCPWAVSAVRSVGNIHNNNGILVWGLEGGRLFDLRFCKDEDRPMPKPPQHRLQDRHTRPAVVFDVRPGRKQMRYGMAFDYDDQLGIVASASTDFHKTHRMGLWDVSSGRMLEPSPLVKHGFSQPVTCAQFVDLEHRGSVKSLLTASGKDILAWDM